MSNIEEGSPTLDHYCQKLSDFMYSAKSDLKKRALLDSQRRECSDEDAGPSNNDGSNEYVVEDEYFEADESVNGNENVVDNLTVSPSHSQEVPVETDACDFKESEHAPDFNESEDD